MRRERDSREGVRGFGLLLRDYAELTKARLVLLVMVTAGVGFLMATRGRPDLRALVLALVGTGLTAAGSMAFNELLETARDGRMERTRNRPLPAGTMTPRHALVIGLLTVAAGLLVLWLGAGRLSALLGLAVVLVYLLVYTPLKPRTPLCTLAGAVCGAIPPLIGWTATGAPLSFGAWLLAGVLFLWQIPHFLSLAWLYREDYLRGGFRMLPVVDRAGRTTGQMTVLYSLALMPVGVLALLGGVAGWVFAAGAFLLGLALATLSARLAVLRTEAVARLLFLATLAYLPLLLGLMVADKVPAAPDVAVALLSGSR